MKRFVLILIICSLAQLGYTQLDKEKKAFKIPVEVTKEPEKKKEEIKTPKKVNSGVKAPEINLGLSKPDEDNVNGLTVNRAEPLNTSKEPFSMLGGEQFGNPGELYGGRIKKQVKDINQTFKSEPERYGATTDQFLGDFKSNAKTIHIVYRDHEFPDGDRIRVFVNDDVYQADILLMPTFKGFKLELKEGFNKIDFFALNQGESGPNTAEFKVVDENGIIISSNQWNLATGVKATIIIVKENDNLHKSANN